ncbi:pyruvate kinase [Blautia sp.]|uniref:pyruvate kinase n=1 Tax=Blautia sp. TaxID=1955243 RepID=UPI003A8BFDC6
MKRTKIICTMGPASSKKNTLRAMMRAGMDIARFNFSHGSHEEHRGRVDMVKNLREELNIPVALLLDTKGPEIRTKLLKDHKKITLEAGSEFTLTTGDIEGDETRVAITYENLYKDVKKGGKILIDDGLIELEIENIKNGDIVCRVLNGGELGERKGINVPYVKVKLPGITEQDKEDILFGITQEFDYIAASFVRDAKAIKEIRQLLDENGGHDIGIIAKIENAEGVENIDEIIKAADGIMVARGDLGVEIPPSEVPYIQKMIIRKCNENYVPVITATQMLDSMIRNPRPTRAEVADVANAIYDGTDAIMLSGETAAGKYPVDALQMMAEIAEMTEPHLDYKVFIEHRSMDGREKISSAVALATVRTAKNLKANAIVTPTMSGNTARLISNFRPKVPIYAITPNSTIQHKLQLIWGVTPLKGYQRDTTDHIMSQAMNVVRSRHLIHKGDLVVFTAGDPATNMTNGHGAVTNMMHVIEAE